MRFKKIIILITIIRLFACLVTTSSATSSLTHQSPRFNSSISKSDFSTTDNPQIKLKENPTKVSGIYKFIPKFIYSPPSPLPLISELKVTIKNTDNKIINNPKPKIEEINSKAVATTGEYSGSNTWSNLSIDYSFTNGVGPTSPVGDLVIRLNRIKLIGLNFRKNYC